MYADRKRGWMGAAMVLWAWVAAVSVADVGGIGNPSYAEMTSIYVKQETLQGTMLATRARHAEWLGRQRPARAAVILGPWHTIDRWHSDRAQAKLSPGTAVDLAAKATDGKPLWTKRPTWNDGTVHSLAPGSLAARDVRAYLHRTITAAKPVVLTVGVGGGDSIELWLDKKRTHVLDTTDRKSTRLNSSHIPLSRMPSSA